MPGRETQQDRAAFICKKKTASSVKTLQMYLRLHNAHYLSSTQELQRPLFPFILTVERVVIILMDFETVGRDRRH